MKKIVILTIALCYTLVNLGAQEATKDKSDTSYQYTFFYNVFPDASSIPQIGIINLNRGSIKNTVQFGSVNITGTDGLPGDVEGAQFGLVNIADNVKGIQSGFLYTAAKDVEGVQFGLLDFAHNVNGVQFGTVNIANNMKGFNFAFVSVMNDMEGFSFGFVSVEHDVRGVQFAAINFTNSVHGYTFGMINFVNDATDGIPGGFLSIVNKGGYHSIGLGYSAVTPMMLELRIGVPHFYTIFGGGWNPLASSDNSIVMELGGGSNVELGNSGFFISPEISAQMVNLFQFYSRNNSYSRTLLSLSIAAGYNILPNLAITLGPSLTWDAKFMTNYRDQGLAHAKEAPSDAYLFKPAISTAFVNFGDFYLGATASLRFSF